MKSIFLLLLRSAQYRVPGSQPDAEAESAWHQLLGKKAAEYSRFPDTGDWDPLMRPVCFPEPAGLGRDMGAGERVLCMTHPGLRETTSDPQERNAPAI